VQKRQRILADFLNNRGLTWFFKNTALLISHLWRLPLALKDSPLYKDAEYAITWKKVITRVTWFFH